MAFPGLLLGPIAVAPECRTCLGLQGLETPFTWYSPVMTIESCHEVEDKLCLLGTPWAVVINRLHAAYSFFCNAAYADGRSRLVACYIQLLPSLADDCEIIGRHREALRHVLDASWAAMMQLEAVRTNGGMHIHQDNPTWQGFIRGIKQYKKLSRAQQAAICAIRGCMANDPDDLRKAIKLNPSEGEWRYKLGYLLEEERGLPPGRHPPTSEELSTLRLGFKLMPNVDTMTRLARSVVGTGPKGVREAVSLLEQALRLYPKHPRALFLCGCFLATFRGMLGGPRSEDEDDVSSVELFERCLDAVGGQCAYVLFKLGTITLQKDHSTSVDYFDRALAVNRIAVGGFQKEIMRWAETEKRNQDERKRREKRK